MLRVRLTPHELTPTRYSGAPARLDRFLADSGMDPQQLAESLSAGETGILAAALDHIVCDESLLMVFASEVRCKPEEIMMAHTLLQGPAPLSSM